jgi:hypothetical protein
MRVPIIRIGAQRTTMQLPPITPPNGGYSRFGFHPCRHRPRRKQPVTQLGGKFFALDPDHSTRSAV